MRVARSAGQDATTATTAATASGTANSTGELETPELPSSKAWPFDLLVRGDRWPGVCGSSSDIRSTSGWTKGDKLILARNDSYFKGPVNLDTWVYKKVPDAVAVLQQLKTGEIDFGRLDPSSFDEAKAQPNLNALSFSTFGFDETGYPLGSGSNSARVEDAVDEGAIGSRRHLDCLLKEPAEQFAPAAVRKGGVAEYACGQLVGQDVLELEVEVLPLARS